jgi:Ala-tRNA(Pro) deacylase
MELPRWIESTLQQEDVPYRVHHHRPRFTSQDVAAEEHVSGHRLAKVVVVKAGEELVAVVLPASRRLNLFAVGEALGGVPCRLATEQEMAERFTDCEVGAIPPLPHWVGMRMLADASLMETQGDIVFQAGTHEDTIELASTDWRRIAHPTGGRFATSLN